MDVLFREERRVSCRPGAEGAPLVVEDDVFVVELECELGGTKRRDWDDALVIPPFQGTEEILTILAC